MKPSKPNKKRGKKMRKPSSPASPQIQIQTASNAPQIEELAAAAEEDKERRALDLKWLVGAFSSLALDQIVSAYDETGGDPFKAAGVLGSQLVDPGEAAAAEEEEIKEIEQEKKKKKKKKGAEERKQKKVSASSGIVANVIGKGYVKPSSHCGEGTRETDKSRLYSMEEMEEGEEFLCSMLGDYSELGMGVVKDVLGQCGYDVEKSTDKTSDLMYHPSEKENDILQYVGYGCRWCQNKPVCFKNPVYAKQLVMEQED